MRNTEKEIRRRLGIPDDAEKVLIFSESSHWDPDWLFTSKEYYRLRIRHILNAALRELEKEPRRIYSAECIFFLKMYWDRSPEKRDSLRSLMNEGRFRLMGSGFTTPDTILPGTEAIIRDYLYGQEWLRERGVTQEPRLAYLPDNFGNCPGLPGLLRSLGFEYTAVSRIDGMLFPGGDWVSKKYPLPGSSAELLERKLQTTDFVWRGVDGSEMLCHWNAFTYGQGDLLDTCGAWKWMGLRLGYRCRSESHVAKRIERYIRQLAPLARTPYMLCPIGFDFNSPIPDLVTLLDRYNEHRYPDTCVYAVNAGMDDYMDLVSQYRDTLPVIDLDPNPYWMGFYASRPGIKQRCNRLSGELVNAEKLLVASPALISDRIREQLGEAWEIAVTSNHHDFITGTSPNRVWRKEQLPWLKRAQALVEDIQDVLPKSSVVTSPSAVSLPEWVLADGRLLVETPFYRIELDERRGGCITYWYDKMAAANLVAGPSNDLIVYRDTGGLWRLGHEFAGGSFYPVARASENKGIVTAFPRNEYLEVLVESKLDRRRCVRQLRFRNDSPIVRMKIEGSARSRRTVCCRFSTIIQSEKLTMDISSGVIERPVMRHYDPTFWAFRSFVHCRDDASAIGAAVYMNVPNTISSNGRGDLEWIAIRNAKKERAFGFLPVIAHPASGPDPAVQTLEYALRVTPSGDWRDNRLPIEMQALYGDDGSVRDNRQADTFLIIDHEGVVVLALKPADRGAGFVVRLFSPVPSVKHVALSFEGRDIKMAMLCDGRERDSEELPLRDGRALIPLHGGIVSVRLIV
jgi:hypothetical protein